MIKRLFIQENPSPIRNSKKKSVNHKPSQDCSDDELCSEVLEGSDISCQSILTDVANIIVKKKKKKKMR